MATVKLTDRYVERVKAETGERAEAWDTVVPGLCLRATDQGRKTWIVRYRTRDGRQPRMTLSTYPALGLAEARDKAREVLSEVAKGGDPSAERRRKQAVASAEPVRTVDELMDQYLAAVRDGTWRPRGKKKAESTVKGDEGVYRRHLKIPLGRERVEAVTPALVRQVLERVMKTSGLQTNKAWAVGSQAYAYAVKGLGRVETNPFNSVAKLMPAPERDRVLNDEELRRTFHAVRDPSLLRVGEERERVYVGRITAIALEVTFLLLQRRSEVAGMERSELRLDEAEWTIRRERTKSKTHVHMVPLPPRALALIKEAIALSDAQREARELPPSPYVFASPRGDRALGASALTHAMADIYKGLNIEDANLHDWRRTATTSLTSPRGGSFRRFVLTKLLSHSAEEGARVTAIYDRYEYVAEKREALVAWEALLNKITDTALSAVDKPKSRRAGQRLAAGASKLG